MVPSFNNIPAIHNANFTATDGVILVTIWMKLDRVEEKAWAHPRGN